MYNILETAVDDNGYNGVYAFVLNIIENISDNYCIDLCSFEPFDQESNVKYVESFGGKIHFCVHKGNPIKKQIGCFKDLYQVVKDGHYDAVHIHSDVAYKLLLYALAAKLGGAEKILIHSHSSGIEGRHRKIKLLLQHITKDIVPFVANQFLACSKKAATWMYPETVLHGKKFFLINNGINPRKFQFNSVVRSEIKKKLGMEDNFIVGHIGRFCYPKNHSFLIDIFSEIVKKNPKARLLLIGGCVGGESYLDQAKEKVKRLNLNDKVLFMGERSDVSRLMQAMDCFLLPSHFEGLPIVGIEAQAAGLPCFFSDTITRELGITDLAYFISLKILPEEWAVEILETSKIERRDMRQKIAEAGYDIKYEIRQLEKIYQNNDPSIL